MTKVGKYYKLEKWSKLHKRLSILFMVMLFITAVPFLYLAFTIMFGDNDSSILVFSIVQLIFWS